MNPPPCGIATFFDEPLPPVVMPEPMPEPGLSTEWEPDPPPRAEAPQPGNKSGGHTPITRTPPRKRGLLDRLEGWLSRN